MAQMVYTRDYNDDGDDDGDSMEGLGFRVQVMMVIAWRAALSHLRRRRGETDVDGFEYLR